MNLDQISTSLSTRSTGNLRDRESQKTSGDLQGTSGDLRGPQGTSGNQSLLEACLKLA